MNRIRLVSVSFRLSPARSPARQANQLAKRRGWPISTCRRGFNSGTEDLRTDTVTAHNVAILRGTLNQLQTVDAGTNSLYKEWFGAFDQSRYDTVTQHYNDINNALNNDTITYDFNGSDCDSDTFAYTHKGSRTIFLCTLYISAPEIGTDASLARLFEFVARSALLTTTFTVRPSAETWRSTIRAMPSRTPTVTNISPSIWHSRL
jgi:hypothetical protein